MLSIQPKNNRKLKFDPVELKEKFVKELQKMGECTENPTITKLCQSVGVNPHYLDTNIERYDWVEIVLEEYNRLSKDWELNGSGLVDKAKIVIKDCENKGKRASLNETCITIGIPYGQVVVQSYTWQKRIRRLVTNADKRWKKNGGKEYKKIKKLLKEKIKNNEEIVLKEICEEADSSYAGIKEENFEWQKNIIKELRDERENWFRRHSKKKKVVDDRLQTLELVVYSVKELHKYFVEEDAKIDSYRNIGVKLGEKTPIVLSKFMYNLDDTDMTDNRVNYDSFDPKRKIIVDACIKVIQEYDSLLTIPYFLREIKGSFLFCQTSDKKIPLPLKPDDARQHYMEYTRYLYSCFNKNESSTYRRKQIRIKTLLENMYDYEEFKIIVRNVPELIRGTTKNTTIELNKGTCALSFYYNIFHNVAEVFVQKLVLPYQINFNGSRMLIAPYYHMSLLYEEKIFKRKNVEYSVKRYFNFEQGTIRSLNEVLNKDGSQLKSTVELTYKDILSSIDELNNAIQNNSENRYKKQLIEIAIRAFFMLFCGLSGQNVSTLINAEWEGDDEFHINKEGYRIRTIKPRANYRRFAFPISVYAKKALKKYLIIRRIWLDGKYCDKLFPTDIDFMKQTNRIFKSFPGHPEITTRQLRKLYSEVTLMKSGGDLVLVSQILGHSPEINLKHYNSSPQSLVERQLGDFIPSMITFMKDEKEVETKHSSCIKGNEEPTSIVDNNMKLDCGNIFHCLICKHFRTHPTEEDIHKLLSFLYAMNFYLIGRAKGDSDYMQSIIEPTIKIIKTILSYMADKYGVESLIDKMHSRVFITGELTDDWNAYFVLQKQLGNI